MSASGIEPGSAQGPEAPVPELFDIHVMYFVGDPRHIARELSLAFQIHLDAAFKIATEVPITVKRGIAPALARQYLEVLVQLGAQVILLPCTRPSSPPAEPLPPPEPRVEDVRAQRDRARADESRPVARGLFSGAASTETRPRSERPAARGEPPAPRSDRPAPTGTRPAPRSDRPVRRPATVVAREVGYDDVVEPPPVVAPALPLVAPAAAAPPEPRAFPERTAPPTPVDLARPASFPAPVRISGLPAPEEPFELPRASDLASFRPQAAEPEPGEAQLSMVSDVFGALAEQEAASLRPSRPEPEEDVGAFGISFADTPEAKFIDLPLPTPGFAPTRSPEPPPEPAPRGPSAPTLMSAPAEPARRGKLEPQDVAALLGELGLLVEAPRVPTTEGALANATVITAPAQPVVATPSGLSTPTLVTTPSQTTRGEPTSRTDDPDVLDISNAIGSLPAEPDDDLWRPITEHGVEAPTSDRKVGSGLFMAAEADEFVGIGQVSGDPPPMPDEIESFLPSERPQSLPPPVPPGARRSGAPPPLSVRPPRVPPQTTPSRFPRSSRPAPPPVPPVPPPQAAPTPLVSRMPPRLLGLELDKVPPLPGVESFDAASPRRGSAPDPLPGSLSADEFVIAGESVSAGSREVDPGDLASLPAIDIQAGAARSLPAPPERRDEITQSTRRQSNPDPPGRPQLGSPLGPPQAARPGIAERKPVVRLPTRKLGYAAGLLGCSGAIVALGVMLDNSVLYGNASIPSVCLHAFALYAAGAAVLAVAKP